MHRHLQALTAASIPDLTIVVSHGKGDLGVAHPVAVRWSAFVRRMSEPTVLPIDYETYRVLDKRKKNRLKGSVGHFVGGKCSDGQRDSAGVEYRSILTIDVDNFEDDDLVDTLRAGCLPRPLNCSAAIISTMSHLRETPRFRILIALSRTVDHAEYDALSRLVADMISPDLIGVDEVSFRPSQVMYLPAVCRDKAADFEFYYVDGPVLDVDEILDDCPDWREPGVLPKTPAELEREEKFAIRARSFAHRPGTGVFTGSRPDPRQKPGIMGAWCRAYSPSDVIDRFFPQEYEPGRVKGGGRSTETARHTRVGSTGTDGIVVYADTWVYSFHANSDPLCGTSYNAWDFARVKLYGHLDAGLPLDTAPGQRPSFARMLELARQDRAVLAQLQSDAVTEQDFDVAATSTLQKSYCTSIQGSQATRSPEIEAFFSI